MYRDPDMRAGRYRTAATLGPDDVLSCASVPGLSVALSDVFSA